MNCVECKNLLIEYIEGLLDPPQIENIEKHLEECSMCRKEAENARALQDRLIGHSLAIEPINLEDKVMDQILREKNSGHKTADSAGFLYQLRGLFMKNTMIKIAAAAVIVLAILIGVNSIQDSVTFAQVIEPVLNARTIAYDCIFGDPAQGIAVHDIVIGQKIRRSFSNMETVLIIDAENKRMLALDPVHKGAAYLDINGMVADNNRDFLYFVRNALNKARNGPESLVEELGRENINGSDAVGFQFRSGNDEDKIIIWADSTTALPVQIDIHQGESLYTLCNIRFDIPVDESLVSMEPPDGYALQDREVDMTKFSEEDFLTVLQIYAKYMRDGNFPEKLTFEDLLKRVPELGNVVPRMNLKPEEMREIGNVYARGMLFLQNLATSAADWQYTGGGIRYGEADREVFRYRKPDSQSWRVIFGDLHVENVAAQNLPR